MLSIIIPAINEQFLNKTIRDLLTKASGDIEIIVVLDGYWEAPVDDNRVSYIHHGETRGMRAAINSAASLARGQFLMKTDAHCIFGEGFDKILTENYEERTVVVPRRYFLDPEKWEVMDRNPVDYEKMKIHSTREKFTGEEWRSRAEERKDVLIDETMLFQGSCWFMSMDHWKTTISPLQEEGYGRFVQEPTEVCMKTWSTGGKVMVNKKTWYAHKHRDWNRSHHVTSEEQEKGNLYALNLWRNEWEKLKLRFSI